MKDEEMAEELTQEYCKNKDCHCTPYTRCDFVRGYNLGILAGLKAGRPQWHKVAEGDLPKEPIQVLSEQGTPVIYKRDCFCWFEYSPNADNIKLRKWEEPIAWCEKPKYIEE